MIFIGLWRSELRNSIVRSQADGLECPWSSPAVDRVPEDVEAMVSPKWSPRLRPLLRSLFSFRRWDREKEIALVT